MPIAIATFEVPHSQVLILLIALNLCPNARYDFILYYLSRLLLFFLITARSHNKFAQLVVYRITGFPPSIKLLATISAVSIPYRHLVS